MLVMMQIPLILGKEKERRRQKKKKEIIGSRKGR